MICSHWSWWGMGKGSGAPAAFQGSLGFVKCGFKSMQPSLESARGEGGAHIVPGGVGGGGRGSCRQRGFGRVQLSWAWGSGAWSGHMPEPGRIVTHKRRPTGSCWGPGQTCRGLWAGLGSRQQPRLCAGNPEREAAGVACGCESCCCQLSLRQVPQPLCPSPRRPVAFRIME